MVCRHMHGDGACVSHLGVLLTAYVYPVFTRESGLRMTKVCTVKTVKVDHNHT